jgi:hypothetical protein
VLISVTALFIETTPLEFVVSRTSTSLISILSAAEDVPFVTVPLDTLGTASVNFKNIATPVFVKVKSPELSVLG